MSKLIAIDAGHGGYDLGASFQGRAEKDDNLRLALEVQRLLEQQGQRVLMTRDTDVFVPLAERSNMANNANADLFVSLHRNSYIAQTPDTQGVENWIFTTAPAATEEMAQIVLRHVVNVGVQRDRGVRRGNYSVLRRTRMPAMLLEMGFINNEEDNRLFDVNLTAYATAITQGILEALGEPYIPGVPSVDETTRAIQQMLNDWYNTGIVVDGVYGPQTRNALVRAIQTTLNQTTGSSLPVDGIWGPATQAYIPNLRVGDRGNLVYLLQSALYLNGFNPGSIDGVFGPQTQQAVINFQQSRGLQADGVAGPLTFAALFQ